MLIVPAILESFRSLQDKTLKVIFCTNEPTPEQVMGIAQSINSFGYLAFKEETFSKHEKEVLEKLESDFEDRRKTHSQRLRAVLFKVWERNNEGFLEFKNYYEHHLEKLIDHYKKKLD